MPSSTLTSTNLQSLDPTAGLRKLTTSMLRNKIGEVIGSLTKGHESIVLTTHAKPQAVLVPYEEYLAMVSAKSRSPALEFLTTHYDDLAQSMDTPAARAGAKEAFDASAEAFRGLRLTE
jgi:prevent-host-death family protein